MSLLFALLAAALAAGPEVEFGRPGLLRFEKAAGDELAHDIYSIALDGAGRVLVSGPGYIRKLEDPDGDGRFDSASFFWRGPASGCQGMVFHAGSLYTTGGGGLERYDDKDGDGVADGPPELLLPLSGGEHGAHALRIGPDGFLYFLGGNHCNLPRDRVRGYSPVRDFYAGVFCRMDLPAQSIEVWADGMRNAYDFDFTAAGDVIAWDSDSERNEGLPWYRPCRLYLLTPGADCGWRGMGTGETPLGAIDSVRPIAEMGRGSPTGVLCLRDSGLPNPYRGGVLALDWTFGRVDWFRLFGKGASFFSTQEVFLQAPKDLSFAPTDIVADRNGSLLITSGGRGIEGSVYRVSAARKAAAVRPENGGQQPAWEISIAPRDVEQSLASPNLRLRRKAVEGAMRLFADPEKVEGGKETVDRLSRAVLSLGREEDARLSQAAAYALAQLDASRWPAPSLATEDLILGLASVRAAPKGTLPRRAVELAFGALERQSGTVTIRDGALRVLEIAFDRLKAREDPEYYTYDPEWEKVDLSPHRELVDRALAAARPMLEAGGGASDEPMRLAAKLRDPAPETAARIAAKLEERSSASSDMLVLWCLSQLASDWTDETAARVLAWAVDFPQKLRRQQIGRDDKWSIFQRGIWERLLGRHPSLGERLIAEKGFGDAEHVDCIAGAKPDVLALAAARFLERPLPEDATARRKVIELLVDVPVEKSPPGLEPLLRASTSDPALRLAALSGLSRKPSAADRPLFLEALEGKDGALLKPAIDGLRRLPAAAAKDDALAEEVIALIGWGALVDRDPGRVAQRDLVAARLAEITGDSCAYLPAEKGRQRASFECWARWLSSRRPDRKAEVEAALESAGDGEKLVESLLASAPWQDGDAARGKVLFDARRCGSCHHFAGAGQRVGPDLAGVGRRLGLRELLIEIAEPSQVVQERYFFTEYLLKDGESIQGKEIYSSREALLTVTRDGRYRRLDPAQIAQQVAQAQSLMPGGLLSGLTPAQVADLVAYLKSG